MDEVTKSIDIPDFVLTKYHAVNKIKYIIKLFNKVENKEKEQLKQKRKGRYLS